MLTKVLLILAVLFLAVILILVLVVPMFGGPVEKVTVTLPKGFGAVVEYSQRAPTPSPTKVNGQRVPTPSFENNPPQIVSLSMDPFFIRVNGVATANVDASDIEGDALAYLWAADRGTVLDGDLGSEPQVKYQAPSISGLDSLTVTVTDTSANQATLTHSFFVYDDATLETANTYLSGLISLGEKDYKEAILRFDDLLENEPKLYPGYLYRGWAYSRDNEWESAVNDYSSYLGLRPEDRGVLLLRAQASLLSGLPEARESASQDIESFLTPIPQWSTGLQQPYFELRTDAKRLKWIESTIALAPQVMSLVPSTGLP